MRNSIQTYNSHLPTEAQIERKLTIPSNSNCPLCKDAGGDLIYKADKYRVIWADEALYPGFLRVIWNEHIREFSDLSDEDQTLLMKVVVKLERFVLNDMQADKSNVATLGNVVPHLHWHVIPRFTDDAHFPAPVWGAAKQDGGLLSRQKSILTDKEALIQRLARLLGSK